MIRVLLVDDHAVVRAGFQWFLEQEAGVEIVAEADCGETACDLYGRLRPDVVVMDLSLPGMGGLNTICRLLARDPGAKILVFSVHEESIYVKHALAAGACGYISKRSASEMLLEALTVVMQGRVFVEAGLARQLTTDQVTPEVLSPREFEIFHRMALGHTNHEIATELHLSGKTVANYLTSIKSKLNVRTSAELTRLAYRYGLLPD